MDSVRHSSKSWNVSPAVSSQAETDKALDRAWATSVQMERDFDVLSSERFSSEDQIQLGMWKTVFREHQERHNTFKSGLKTYLCNLSSS